MANTSLRSLIIVSLVLAIASCGGSGGGRGNNTPPPNTGWQPGVFLNEATYAARCVAPRSGINPATGQAYPDVAGTVLDENNFLRSWSDRTYLWYAEIVDQDPSLFNNPLVYFDELKTTATTASGAPKDKFHFTYDSEEWYQLSQGGVSAGYGAEWAISSNNGLPPREVLVAYTEPNSPATRILQPLERGARVLAVDGVDINDTTSAGVAVLNAGLFPSAAGKVTVFTIQDPGSSGSRQVGLTSEEVTAAMVQNAQVINTPTGNVGYMTFNYHRAPAEQELIAAINALNAGQGIDDLVLDIRYNGGGFLTIASQLAYMIAGPTLTAGRTFETLQFNDKHPTTNPVTGQAITPTPFVDETVGFSVPAGQALPTLNLSRVFVLTGPGTCSASEAVMNGLRGAGVEVIQIGSTTCGKPYGFYATDNCGTTYFTIQFRGVNDANYGDYTDGFVPSAVDDGAASVRGCPVADDFSKQLGDPDENRLEVALAYQAGQGCIAPAAVVAGELGKPGLQLQGRDATVPRSPFDSNRIMGRP